MNKISLSVNGRTHAVTVDADTPLLYVLRDNLNLKGPRFGCGLGQCGACVVMADGEAIYSCLTPISVLEKRKIRTLEGLGSAEKAGPMQRAFIEEQAAQCGYCIPGIMLRAQALLERNPRASEAEVRAALQPHLCRCGTHMRIVHAVLRAGELMRGKS
jgi:nicotinate dehydrogenase subunit A